MDRLTRDACLVLLLAGCGRLSYDASSPDGGEADTTPRDDSMVSADAGDTGPAPDPSLRLWVPCESDTLDHSGNGVPVSCAMDECPRLETWNGRPACRFDGLDDYMRVPSAPLAVDGTHTISAWVWIEAIDLDFAAIAGRPYRSGANNSYEIYYDAQDARPAELTFKINDGIVFARARIVHTTFDRWHHVAGTFDGTTLVLFLDGASVATALGGAYLSDDNDLLIAADRDAALRNFLDGWLSDLRVYDRALSSEEIEALAAP